MKTNEKKKTRLPVPCKILYALFALSALLFSAFLISPTFADWFNTTVSYVLRILFALPTNLFPFSLAEALLILLPVILVAVCFIGYRRYCDSWKGVFTYIAILLSALSVVLSIFVWNFAAGYYAPSLDKKLEMERAPVSKEELYQTSQILLKELNELAPDLISAQSGATAMPYSLSEMNGKLLEAYETASEKYGAFSTFPSALKPVMLSEPMSYTHITGVYTFFTGEANLNVNFPDYTLPYTAAHELAHQRGIAREDEANFVAFLVCLESDDPYIRYSGLLSTYEYVLSALRSQDAELYREAYRALPEVIRREESAYSAFFEKYRENVAANVSQATNDTYLKSMGSESGTRSYGMVVDLTVAFYRPFFD